MKWHEVDTKTGVKTKAIFEYCHKCGMRVVGKATDTYPLCHLCFAKTHKWYKEIRHLLTYGDGWYGKWHGLEDGHEYKKRIVIAKLFSAIMNAGSMNRTPKVNDVKYFIVHELEIPRIWVEKFA